MKKALLIISVLLLILIVLFIMCDKNVYSGESCHPFRLKVYHFIL